MIGCLLLAAMLGLAATAAPAHAAERLIVRFAPEASAADRDAAIRAADGRQVKTLATGAQVIVAADGARRRLDQDPRVDGVEVDHAMTVAVAAPDDAAFDALWGLSNMGQTVRSVAGVAGEDVRVLDAWDHTLGSGSTVAVLDTGTDLAIADLGVNAWSNPGEIAGNGIDDDGNGKVDDTTGWSFTSDSADIGDDHGHGTHVAGTAVAAADNGDGIAGVAPRARLMTVKVLAGDGSGWTSDIADGFEYAAREGAQVVNASLGGGGWSVYLRDAIARHPDVVLVAAAGNDAADVDESPLYPCAYDLANVVCVASHDNTGALSWFSNFGDVSVDVAAPGRDVLSWTPGGTLAYMSGTSMATPHVAGAAALVAAAAPGTSPEALRDALIATARRSSDLAGSSVSGGALDAAALLAAPPAEPARPPTVLTAPTLTGEAVVGRTLTAGGASFDGETSIAWRWQSCRTDGSDCQAVSGASGSTLRLSSGLGGRRVRAVAVATNDGGTTTAASALTATVVHPLPSLLGAPRVVGEPVVGARLVSDLGAWMHGAADRIWFERCTHDLSSCEPAGSGGAYVATRADVGRRLRAVVRATGAGGSGYATSTPTAPVVRPRVRLRAARRAIKRGRPVLRVAGRSSVTGRLALRVCRRGMRRACRSSRRRVRAGRWTRTVRLPTRMKTGRLTIRATLVPGDGRRARARRAIR